MKLGYWIGWMVGIAGSLVAQETVHVTGNRVSLRAAPTVNAVLLDRAMLHDELVLADNTNPEWVGVVPPDSIDAWVASEYVEAGVVTPPLLNVRSGPSLSHAILGTVSRGEVLTVRSEVEGWIRMAPTPNLQVWISRNYTDIQHDQPVMIHISADQAAVSQGLTQAEVDQVLISAAQLVEVPAELTADPEKNQGVIGVFDGVLRKAGDKLYKLMDAKTGALVVCYVRGNMAQLAKVKGRSLSIRGGAYWAVGLDKPVLVPTQIKVKKSLLND